MAVTNRIFAFSIMGLILAFAIIHLGVSIGIIASYRHYGDIFSPQVGLSSFNLVIALLGLVTGILGLAAILMNSEGLAKIVCLISCALGIFALASLVTALIINSKSLSYVSSHFASNILEYQTNPSSQSKVDRLQNKYQCCGTDLWIDWSTAQLNVTSSMTNVTGTNMTTAVSSMNSTSMATTSALTTVSAGAVGSTTTTAGTTTAGSTTTTAGTSTNSSSGSKNVKRDINHISNDLRRRQLRQLADYSRKKRQVLSNYGGIVGLPITFGVTLPASCCTPGALLIGNTSNAYCVSNANNAVNHFNEAGCAKPIDVTAGNQAMGIGVINSFMVVLAFVAIPIMLGDPSVPI